MARFYINDSAVPGARMPTADYRKAVRNLGSDVLNEAQAITKGRKLTKTAYPPGHFRYWQLWFTGPGFASTGIRLNEIEMFDHYGSNRVLGLVASANRAMLDIGDPYVLTDGIKPLNVATANSYTGFAGVTAGNPGYLTWDLGAALRLETMRTYSPERTDIFQYSYAPSQMYVKAGNTTDCADFVSAALYHGNTFNVLNTIQ